MLKPEQPNRRHEIPDRPWSKVGTDLFMYNNQIYITAVDYFSNFIEMDSSRDYLLGQLSKL